MPITVDPELAEKLRARAEAEGITVNAYVERLIREDDNEIAHTEALLEQAAQSGEYIELNEQEWDRIEREALSVEPPQPQPRV